MCWSLGASTFFSALAMVLAVNFKSAGWARVAFAYWSLMELIQALQYTVIDECGNFYNYWLTIAALLHLCFQPFFYCIYLLHFVEKRNHAVAWGVARVALIASTFLAVRMVDMDPDSAFACDASKDPLCGKQVCSYSTKVHVAWIAPMRACDAEYMSPGWSMHGLFWVAAPVSVGAWWVAIYEIITGPMAAAYISGDKNGTGAIWCMYATGQLLLVVMYNLRRKKAAVVDESSDKLINGSSQCVESQPSKKARVGAGGVDKVVCGRSADRPDAGGKKSVLQPLLAYFDRIGNGLYNLVDTGEDKTSDLSAQNSPLWWFQTLVACLVVVVVMPLLRLAQPDEPHSGEPAMIPAL